MIYKLRFCAIPLVATLCISLARAESPYPTDWIRQIGNSSTFGRGIAADPLGNVLLSGSTTANLGGPNAGFQDAFLAKFSNTGQLLWARQAGTSAGDGATGTASDSFGNAFICGDTQGSLGGASQGGGDAFLRKYDSAGNLLWSRLYGGSLYDEANSMAVDTLGNAFFTGSSETPSTRHAILVKYDPAGNLLWSRTFGTSDVDQGNRMTVDGAGNAYVTGHTYGNIGGPNAGGQDAFVSKYDSAGNLVWSRQFGTALDDQGNAIGVDATGNVYFGGLTNGNFSGVNSGPSDGYLVKLDSAGNLVWSRQFGTSVDEGVNSLSVDAFGNILLTGATDGALGGASAGSADLYVQKYDSAGNLLWTKQMGGSAFDRANDIVSDPYSGKLFIAGQTGDGPLAPNAGSGGAFVISLAPVPEPSSIILAVAGLSVGIFKRRRSTDHFLGE
jgi:hypothetical protein